MQRELLHIAFDDTDSRMGRCTTHLAFTIVEQLKKMNIEEAIKIKQGALDRYNAR